MAQTKDRTKNTHEVVIRHALFRYHNIKKSATGKEEIHIKHAERGATIMVNDDDYDRGVEGGAFFMGQPEVDIKSAMGGLQTLEDRIRESQQGAGGNLDGDPSKNDDEFDFEKASDEELTDFMQRNDPDVIIVKTQGTDDALIKRVLGVEYQITDGDPRPEIKNVLVDLLGTNPEEDADGKWLNEPEVEEDSPKAQQRKARRATGTRKTARSTKNDSGA